MGKHSIKKEKRNLNKKSVLLFTLILIFVISIICIRIGIKEKENFSEQKRAIDMFFSALKESNSEEISSEDSLKELSNILKENNYGTKSIIKKIQIIEQEDKFKIVVNDDLINLLYPGIENVNDIL